MRYTTLLLSLISLVFCTVASLQAEEPHEKWLNYLAGEWKVTMNDEPGGSSSYTPFGQTNALSLSGKHPSGFMIHGIIGWCPDYGMFVETAFMTGNRRSLREYTHITEEVISGVYKDQFPGGAEAGRIEYRSIDNNTMELTTATLDGEKQTARVRFVRKNKE